jgi:hypothetical protein
MRFSFATISTPRQALLVHPERNELRDGYHRALLPDPRVLRLMRLAPDIVEAILDGKQGAEVTLARVMGPFPIQWQAQSGRFA